MVRRNWSGCSRRSPMTPTDPRSNAPMPSSGLTRRQFLPLLGAAAASTAAPGMLAAARPDSDAAERFVYVGTYTAPGVPPGGTHPSTAVGIYVFRMNAHDGGLTPVQVVTTDNPSFLALDPSLTHLYSTNENVSGRVSRLRHQPRKRQAQLSQHRGEQRVLSR